MKKSAAIAVLSLLLYLNANAQQFNGRLRSLTMEDGLPQGFVSGLVQDQEGFLWLGTRDGLARYDGREVRVYRHDDGDSTSLSGNIIRSLSLSGDDKIWIQYENGRIDRLDPKTGKINRLTTQPGLSRLTIGRSMTNFFPFVFDRSGSAYLLFADSTDRRKLIRILPGQSGVDTMPSTHSMELLDVAANEQGEVLLLSTSALYSLNDNGHPALVAPLPDKLKSEVAGMARKWCHSLISDGSRNTLHILSLNSLWTYSKPARQWEHLPLPSTLDGGSRHILQDGEGGFFLVDHNVLWRVSNTGKISRYWENKLPHPEIINAMMDRTGVVWIATNTFGLRILDTRNAVFHSYETNHDFFYDVIPSVYGLRVNAYDPYVYSNHILGGRTALDNKRRFWFLNFLYSNINGVKVEPNHLIRVDDDGPHVMNLVLKEMERINNFCFDVFGRCWATCIPTGALLQIDPATGKIEKRVLADMKRGYPMSMFSMDTMLCVVYPDAVMLYDTQKDQFKTFRDQPGLEVFRNGDLMTGTRDLRQRNVIWLASGGQGLIRLDILTGKATRYSVKDGLPNSTVYSIKTDKKGFFWCSSNMGIFRFDPGTGRVLSFTIDNGLQGNEFNKDHHMEFPDGRFAFGGTDGWTIFHPDSIHIDTYQPKVVLTGLMIRNEPFEKYKELYVPLASLDTLTLTHNQNFLTFRFAALQYNDPGKISYRYRLQQLDTAWVYLGNQNTANFTSLPPGKYTLEINASNTAGAWSPHVKTIMLFIRPPWWATWWAYLSYALLFTGITVGLFRIRLKQSQARQQALMQAKEAEQLREIDEMKSRFFSNITHEFRTPLSLIISPVEQMQKDPSTPSKIRAGLHLVQQNARHMLRLVNQLLDMSKVEAGSMGISLCRGDLAKFIEERVANFQNAASAKNIRLVSSVRGGGHDLLFDADKLEKIMYNLLSNAIKFTPEGGEVRIDYWETARVEGGYVGIQVADTGIGISPADLPHIFDRFFQGDSSSTRNYQGTGIGLSLLKELLLLMGGDINVDSTLGKGTSFHITLPLHSAEGSNVPEWRSPAMPMNETPATAPLPGGDAPADAPLILLAEDSEDLRHFISGNLSNDFRVLTAANGRQALELAEREMPDLVITDVMMPEMDGLELCRRIKTQAATEHIAVVMLTAKTAHSSVMDGLSGGADDYVTKPFHIDELLARLRNILERKEKLKRHFQASLQDTREAISPQPEEHPFVASIVAVIEEQLDNSSFTVEDLAGKLAMSSRTLNRKLASVIGLSANELIRQYRLKRSLDLLKQGCNVSETAYQVGFETHSYFTTAFKAFYGCTPSEFQAREIATKK